MVLVNREFFRLALKVQYKQLEIKIYPLIKIPKGFKMKKGLIALSLLLATNVNATKYQDTFTTVIHDSEEVAKAYYSKNDYELHSPYFNKNWNAESKFTSYDEMLEFTKNIAKNNAWAELRYFGKSQEGKNIPYLYLSNNKNSNNKVKVWLQGGIHGNEPAGAEGMLALLGLMESNQTQTNKWLQDMDIIVVPRFNVDGTDYFQRRSARNIDFNRDHIKITLPEMQTVKDIFNEFSPQVVVDNHEYTTYRNELKKYGTDGYAVPYDALLAGAKNLNIDESLRTITNSLVIDDMKSSLHDHNFTHETYVTYNKKGDTLAINEAGTAGRIGRNAGGLSNSISILTESRGVGMGNQHFNRRVKTQLVMNESVLNTTVTNKAEILATVKNAIDKTIADGKNGTNDIIVKSKKTTGKKNYNFIEIATGELVTVDAKYNFSSKEVPTLTRTRPKAYVIPAAFSYVTEKIKNLGLEVEILTEPRTMKVEAFEITSSKVSTTLYEGEFRNTLGSKLVNRTVEFPAGTAVVSMAQKNANLMMLALEPDSGDSFATFNIIPVSKGDEFPVFRYHGE